MTNANDCPPPPEPNAANWFKEWFDSPYYYQLYANRDENEAAALIDRLLDLLQPPPGSTMLDVACGRGRHAGILAKHGFDVTGIDLAPSAIAFARQFENEHLHFYLHDMRRTLCTNCFDYLFNFFTSLFWGEKAERNPWHSNTLEWTAPSPPGHGNFEVTPIVRRGPYEYNVPGMTEDYLPQTAAQPEGLHVAPAH